MEIYRLNKHVLDPGFDIVLLVSASDSGFYAWQEKMFALFRMAKLFVDINLK